MNLHTFNQLTRLIGHYFRENPAGNFADFQSASKNGQSYRLGSFVSIRANGEVVLNKPPYLNPVPGGYQIQTKQSRSTIVTKPSLLGVSYRREVNYGLSYEVCTNSGAVMSEAEFRARQKKFMEAAINAGISFVDGQLGRQKAWNYGASKPAAAPKAPAAGFYPAHSSAATIPFPGWSASRPTLDRKVA